MTEEDKIIAECDAETIESLRAQVAELKVENERLSMALADTEALEIGTAERCDELTRQRDEFKADAERFEWMLDHPDATVCSDGSYGPVHIWFRYSNRLVGYGSKTAREAIDAAMKGATE